MPVVAIAPSGPLFEKTASNLQEAQARGGQLIVFTDAAGAGKTSAASRPRSWCCRRSIRSPRRSWTRSRCSFWPIMVAVLKGTDVDQPRNLAKSVTVE